MFNYQQEGWAHGFLLADTSAGNDKRFFVCCYFMRFNGIYRRNKPRKTNHIAAKTMSIGEQSVEGPLPA